MRYAAAFLVAFLAMSFHARAQTAANIEPSGSITLRSSQAPLNGLQSALAKYGKERNLIIPATIAPERIFREACGGAFTTTFQNLVIESNPGLVLAKSDKERNIRVPPCPRFKRNVSVIVIPGETLSDILKRSMGVGPGDVIFVCDIEDKKKEGCELSALEAVRRLNGGDKFNPDSLTGGVSIQIPFVTEYVNIPLKENVDVGEAISSIFDSSQVNFENSRQLSSLYLSQDLKIIAPLLGNDSQLSTSCRDIPTGNKWPFDAALLRDRINRTLAQGKEKGVPHRAAVVRVADTGFVGVGTFFPLNGLAVNERERLGGFVDRDGNGWPGDYYGIDAERKGDISAFAKGDEKEIRHGTQVADYVLGGKDFRSLFPFVNSLIKLNFAKLLDNSRAINEAMLSYSVSYSSPPPVVVNFSVGGRRSLPAFEDAMSSNKNVLVVVAAGNSAENINEIEFYPADYSGNAYSFHRRVITVGAHDPYFKWATFSNYSPDKVDILAPGCALPSVGPDGIFSTLAGTSLAAPLVTNGAAFLYALGINRVEQIKERIMMSADHIPDLNARSVGGAVLNLPRAVTIFDDIVNIFDRSGISTDILGEWLDDSISSLCSDREPFRKERVNKIQVVKSSGHPIELRVYTRDVRGNPLGPISCIARHYPFKFKELGGNIIEFNWEQINFLLRAELI